MTRQRLVFNFLRVAIIGMAVGAAIRVSAVSLQTVYRGEIPRPTDVPQAVAPGREEILAVRYSSLGQPARFSIIDLRTSSEKEVAVSLEGNIQRLWLHEIKRYSGSELVASASWLEAPSTPRNGLVFLDRNGKLNKMVPMGAAVRSIDTVGHGLIVASVQEPKDTKNGEAQGRPTIQDTWILSRDKRKILRTRLAVGGGLAYRTWDEQRADLRRRRVFSFDGWWVMTQPTKGVATVEKRGGDVSRHLETLSGGGSAYSAFFSPPEGAEGAHTLDIVPIDLPSFRGYAALWGQETTSTIRPGGSGATVWLCTHGSRGGSPTGCVPWEQKQEQVVNLWAGEGSAYAMIVEVSKDVITGAMRSSWRLVRILP